MSDYVEKNNIDPITGKNIAEPIVMVSESEYTVKENIDPITGKPIATPVINIDGSGGATDVKYDVDNIHNGLIGTNFRIYNTDGTYRSNPLEPLVAPYQKKLVAGENITIDNVTNTISATGGASDVTKAYVDSQNADQDLVISSKLSAIIYDNDKPNFALKTELHDGSTQQNYKVTKDTGHPVQPSDYGSNLATLLTNFVTTFFTSFTGNTGRPGIWGTSKIAGILTKPDPTTNEFAYLAPNIDTGEVFIGRRDNANTTYTGLLSRVQTLVLSTPSPSGGYTIANQKSHNIFANPTSILVNEGVLQTAWVNNTPTIGQNTLLRLPARPHNINYIIRCTITVTGLTPGTGSQNDEIIIELWNRDTKLRTKEITRASLSRDNGSVDFPIYTLGINDLMSVADGGFKLVVNNQCGTTLTNLSANVGIFRG